MNEAEFWHTMLRVLKSAKSKLDVRLPANQAAEAVEKLGLVLDVLTESIEEELSCG